MLFDYKSVLFDWSIEFDAIIYRWYQWIWWHRNAISQKAG